MPAGASATTHRWTTWPGPPTRPCSCRGAGTTPGCPTGSRPSSMRGWPSSVPPGGRCCCVPTWPPATAAPRGASRRGTTAPARTPISSGRWVWMSARHSPYHPQGPSIDGNHRDDMVLVLLLGDPAAGDREAAHADPLAVDPLRVAGEQRVPAGLLAPLGYPAVGTKVRQPAELLDPLGRQAGAVRHPLQAVLVVAAAAAVNVEQLAGQVEHRQLAALLVLELEQAALAAAIAERLPLLGGELLQGVLLPEPFTHQ